MNSCVGSGQTWGRTLNLVRARRRYATLPMQLASGEITNSNTPNLLTKPQARYNML